jgi:hypothetical protein
VAQIIMFVPFQNHRYIPILANDSSAVNSVVHSVGEIKLLRLGSSQQMYLRRLDSSLLVAVPFSKCNSSIFSNWNLCLRGKGSLDTALNLCLCGKGSIGLGSKQ